VEDAKGSTWPTLTKRWLIEKKGRTMATTSPLRSSAVAKSLSPFPKGRHTAQERGKGLSGGDDGRGIFLPFRPEESNKRLLLISVGVEQGGGHGKREGICSATRI